MQTQVKYQVETIVVPLGNRTIQVHTRTPILSQKERERRKREAEQRLFDVFSKYAEA